MSFGDTGIKPFKLLRYYSVTSLVAFVVVAVVLAALYREVATRDLVRMAEGKNVALTQAFANSLWVHFSPLVRSQPTLSTSELHQRIEAVGLQQAVLDQSAGLSVVKLKAYRLDGTVVFSTQPTQIGDIKSENAGFLSARRGEVATELTHRDTFSSFEREIADRDVISSYVPIRLGEPSSAIVGVFEVYDDVTPFLAAIKKTQRNIFIGVALVLSILYSILFLVVRRGDRIISDHARQRQVALDELENRVKERTHALYQSEAQFKQAARIANLGHWIRSQDGQAYLSISEEYANIHGFSRTAFLRAHATLEQSLNRIEAKDRARYSEAFDAMLGGASLDIEYRISRADGELRYVREIGECERAEDDLPGQCLGTLQDITDRTLVESRRFAAARRERDVLIREVHHRIKNSLQGVVGLLGEHRRTHPELEEILTRVTAQVGTIALVHGLEAQGKSERSTLVDLVSSIRAAAHGPLKVQMDTSSLPPRMLTMFVAQSEVVPVALIINELVTNAFKHLASEPPMPPSIAIKMVAETHEIGILICNTPARLPCGFNLDSGVEVGTGLGLVKSLMPASGARLTLKMHGDGVTAELRLGLPVIESKKIDGRAPTTNGSSEITNENLQ